MMAHQHLTPLEHHNFLLQWHTRKMRQVARVVRMTHLGPVFSHTHTHTHRYRHTCRTHRRKCATFSSLWLLCFRYRSLVLALSRLNNKKVFIYTHPHTHTHVHTHSHTHTRDTHTLSLSLTHAHLHHSRGAPFAGLKAFVGCGTDLKRPPSALFAQKLHQHVHQRHYSVWNVLRSFRERGRGEGFFNFCSR